MTAPDYHATIQVSVVALKMRQACGFGQYGEQRVSSRRLCAWFGCLLGCNHVYSIRVLLDLQVQHFIHSITHHSIKIQPGPVFSSLAISPVSTVSLSPINCLCLPP